MVKVKLLRPLDGQPIGSEVEYERHDAERLRRGGVVELVKAEPPVANKMEPPVANKAAAPAKPGAGR